MMSKAKKLRTLLQEKPILKIMGAHNALGAKLIEKHGFDGVWSSGFEIATAHGVPDAEILTATENLAAAQNIHTATRLPVICDCDTGYGNAINVMHMVRKYESAGMAAVVIEDKCVPKKNSFISGRQDLAPIEEFCGKIKAAKDAASSREGILVFARVEALIAGWEIKEALLRAAAYKDAGADGIVIHSKSKSPDEIFAFAEKWKEFVNDCPLIAIPTTYYSVTAEELAREGFKMVIYANQGIRAAVKAMDHVFGEISKSGTSRGIEKEIAPMEELFHLQGMPTYQEDQKRYSPKITVVIPAAADHQFQPELSNLLKDQPLCMLKIADKTVLEHQLETLNPLGVRETRVVAGHKKEKVSAPGIIKIENRDFSTKGSAHSVMAGLQDLAEDALVCYSDILFERHIPEGLIQAQRKSQYPVILVIDRAFRSLPRRDKSLDLVITEEDLDMPSSRKMGVGHLRKISKIGKKIDSNKAGYEFIGMFMLARKGLAILEECWEKAQEEFRHRPFQESANIEQASMTDLFQYVIECPSPRYPAFEIFGLVIEHGWSEIYSLDDYERLNRYFTEKVSGLLESARVP